MEASNVTQFLRIGGQRKPGWRHVLCAWARIAHLGQAASQGAVAPLGHDAHNSWQYEASNTVGSLPKSRGLLCIFCIFCKALKSLCNVKHVCGETLCCLFLWFHAKIEQEEFVINSLQLFTEKNGKIKLGGHQSDFSTNPSSLNKNDQI